MFPLQSARSVPVIRYLCRNAAALTGTVSPDAMPFTSAADSIASSSGRTTSWPSAMVGTDMAIRCIRTAASPAALMHKAASSASVAPDAPSFHLSVEVTAFEPRYCDAASTVIHDLFLVNFAPKADPAHPVGPCGISVAAEKRSVKLDWKKSRFTLIRGPHIDKFGMEQFETRKYRKVVSASTPSADEMHWMLEHLKLFEFTGVQIKVDVTSNTYLTPASTGSITQQQQQQLGGGGGVLAQHRAEIAHYLRPAAATAAAEASGSRRDAEEEEQLRASLQTLRGALLTGLKGRRETLKAAQWYQAWHNKNKPSAVSAGMHPPPQQVAAVDGGSSHAEDDVAGLSDERRRHAASLLAAIDASLLSLRFDGLERHAGFPFHFATLVPGSGPLPAAEWMHAVLKYGQYKQKLAQLTEEAQLLKAYSSYTVFAHTLLHTLFRVWTQQTVAENKPYLALPSKAETEEFMQSVAKGGASVANPQASSRGNLFSH